MKVVDIKCPGCGAELHISGDRTECFCEYCGSKILLDDGGVKNVTIIRDEVKLKELQIQEETIKKMEEELADLRILQSKSKKRKPIDWFFIIGIVVFEILWIVYKNTPADATLTIGDICGMIGNVCMIGALVRWLVRGKYDSKVAVLESNLNKIKLKRANII